MKYGNTVWSEEGIDTCCTTDKIIIDFISENEYSIFLVGIQQMTALQLYHIKLQTYHKSKT